MIKIEVCELLEKIILNGYSYNIINEATILKNLKLIINENSNARIASSKLLLSLSS